MYQEVGGNERLLNDYFHQILCSTGAYFNKSVLGVLALVEVQMLVRFK